MDSFSCIHFLRKLYLNFHMHYYINITLKYHFRSRHDRFDFYLYDVDVEMFGVMTSELMCDVKKTSCMRAVIHPLCNTTFPSPGRVYGNSG